MSGIFDELKFKQNLFWSFQGNSEWNVFYVFI
jgi:hypothetical protein